MEKFCINCGASLDSDSMFCPSCGAKQSTSAKISTDEIVPETVAYSISLKDKFNNMTSKYHLIPSDIIVMIGAFITILGIYIFNAFSITLPDLRSLNYTFAGQIGYYKMSLETVLDSDSTDSILWAYHEIVVIVVVLTIISIMMVVSTFINKRIFKIISVIALLMITIWYYTKKIQIVTGASDAYSESIANIQFGPAYNVILIGMLVMLGGSCYSLYKFIQKNNHKISSL